MYQINLYHLICTITIQSFLSISYMSLITILYTHQYFHLHTFLSLPISLYICSFNCNCAFNLSFKHNTGNITHNIFISISPSIRSLSNIPMQMSLTITFIPNLFLSYKQVSSRFFFSVTDVLYFSKTLK